MTTIKASSKGELLLTKELLEAHGFSGGAEVEVSGGAKQIVLKLVEAKQAEPTKKLTIEEFLARRIRYTGPPLTDEMMSNAIVEEAKRRWDEENSR